MIPLLLFLAAAVPGVRTAYEASAPGGAVARFWLSHLADGWRLLEVEKRDGSRFRVWRQGQQRYLVERAGQVNDYRHAVTGAAVLPSAAPESVWWPPEGGRVQYLGHPFTRGSVEPVPPPPPPAAHLVDLRPDLWIGQASNTRQKDETRRYDGSDYELIPLARDDYARLAAAGVTVVKAVGAQQAWASELGLFFWGPLDQLPWPDLLYDSQYLGPALFLDEPAVGTRDHDLRPRLAKDPTFRRAITPAAAFAAFQQHYARTLREGAPRQFMRALRSRRDIDLGALDFDQQNLYDWETMPETAGWALTQDPAVPAAFVFEPPGRLGTRRTLPEWNMAYGTRFRTDDVRVLPAVVFGFLRGAARLAGKQWGISIYGAVERADAFLWLTRAYDQGATRFFFWDNYQLACVPFGEVLTLARHLRDHARDHAPLAPRASRAILLPPGYGLGHTHTGRGNLWGLPELNLERANHRAVMSGFFAAIEESLRAGVDFDLFLDLPGLAWRDYREVLRPAPRPPAPDPAGPGLSVRLERHGDRVVARARVEERNSPVYYTFGADPAGVRHNARVLFELYGPAEEDYLFLLAKDMRPDVRELAPGVHEVRVDFTLPAPGRYRLRAATADLAGHSTVVWTNVE